MIIYALLIITIIELVVSYFLDHDILSPSFIFSFVFVLSELNLLTNVSFLDLTLHDITLYVIVGGIACFGVGSLLASKIFIRSRKKMVNIPRNISCASFEKYLNNKYLTFILIINIITILYVTHEVVNIAYSYGFGGTFFGAIGRYAELAKFSSYDIKISTVSTLLTAFSEAAGYLCAAIIIKCLVNKERPGFLLFLSFITSFISTFCQGSRGGIFMILTSIIIYIILYRAKHGKRHLSGKIVFRISVIMFLGLISFSFAGNIMNKTWNISFYEYLSVYLGFPILNLDIALSSGATLGPFSGFYTFGGILAKIFPLIGLELPKYGALSKFVSFNGHNLGNVYTIFAYLISDFGYCGMSIALMIIGFVSKLIHNIAKNPRESSLVSKILYGYLYCSLAFSFFSNKFCENINYYHFFVFIFIIILNKILVNSSKSKISCLTSNERQ